MKKILLITLNAALLAMILGGIYDRARHFPIDTLNEGSNFLQSQDLFALENGNATPCSTFWLEQWRKYVMDITRYAPQLNDSYSFLGFYNIINDHPQEAIAAYERAKTGNTTYWANDYNLGVIYFRQKNYLKAIAYFEKAATSEIRLNAYAMTSSKLYADLIRQAKGLNIDYRQRLQNGNDLCLLAIKACAYALQRQDPPPEFSLSPVLF